MLLDECTCCRSDILETTCVKKLVRGQNDYVAVRIDDHTLKHSEIYEDIGIPEPGFESKRSRLDAPVTPSQQTLLGIRGTSRSCEFLGPSSKLNPRSLEGTWRRIDPVDSLKVSGCLTLSSSANNRALGS